MTEQSAVDIVAGSITGAYAGTNELPDPPIGFVEALKELALSTRVQVSGIPINQVEVTGSVTF